MKGQGDGLTADLAIFECQFGFLLMGLVIVTSSYQRRSFKLVLEVELKAGVWQLPAGFRAENDDVCGRGCSTNR